MGSYDAVKRQSPIELAPNWKRNLTLSHPLMLAAGGYAAPDAARVGAFVTLPTTLRPRSGAPPPRVVEIPGGVLLRTGAANPGLSKVLREYARVWAKSTVPIIVAFAAQGVDDWVAMAAPLEHVPGVGGIELHLNPTIGAADAIRTVRAATELPLLAKLDLDNAGAIAGDCIAAGANALVISRAPRGMRWLEGKAWYGRMYGAMVKPLVLRVLAEIRDLRLDAPLVACGGVHSADDAREFLAAGASAVELDSAHWIEPSIVAHTAGELAK